MNATVRRIHSPAVALSDRARASLLHVAHEGAQLAAELARVETDDEGAYLEAREQLLAVRQGLIENRRMSYFTINAGRVYALRCVIAWTTRRAAPALRHELRSFANHLEVTL